MDVTNTWDPLNTENPSQTTQQHLRDKQTPADSGLQIVNVVESTGHYTLTKTTFDFDLCKLDPPCLNKLFGLIEDVNCLDLKIELINPWICCCTLNYYYSYFSCFVVVVVVVVVVVLLD